MEVAVICFYHPGRPLFLFFFRFETLLVHFGLVNAEFKSVFDWISIHRTVLASSVLHSVTKMHTWQICFKKDIFRPHENVTFLSRAYTSRMYPSCPKDIYHPYGETLPTLFCDQLFETKLSLLSAEIQNHFCWKTLSLLFTKCRALTYFKTSKSSSSTPSIALTLDVMHHIAGDKNLKILVMHNVEDNMIRLHHLIPETTNTSYKAFLSQWISIIDSPIILFVNRGSNLSSAPMHDWLK